MERESEHFELNEKKWDSKAETFDEKRFDYFRYYQKRVISLLHIRENQYFLDIGCGTGWAVRYVASLVKEGGRSHGIDLSSKMIKKAIENSNNYANPYKNTYFCKANAEELPFQNNFFDFVICTNSFHHYLKPSKALSEVYRVLKVGGRIYLLDPTTDGFIMKMVDRWDKNTEREHVKYYSTKDYVQLFTKAKLRYISNKSIFSYMSEKIHIGEKLEIQKE